MNATFMMLAKTVPCIIGVVLGANVEPIKKVVHRAQHTVVHRFKPMDRKVITPDVCIDPQLDRTPLPVNAFTDSKPDPFAMYEDTKGVFGGQASYYSGVIGSGGYNPPLVINKPPKPPVVTPPISAVPEPKTWLSMILGFAMSALFLRKAKFYDNHRTSHR